MLPESASDSAGRSPQQHQLARLYLAFVRPQPVEVHATGQGAALGIPTPYSHALTMLIKARNANMIRQLHEPPIDYEAMEAAAKATP